MLLSTHSVGNKQCWSAKLSSTTPFSLSSTQARLALPSQTPKGNLTAIAWSWSVTNPAVPGRAAQNGIRPVPLRGPYRIRAKCLFSQLTRLGLTSTFRVFPDLSPYKSYVTGMEKKQRTEKKHV